MKTNISRPYSIICSAAAVFVFIYILIRCFLVPISHDEAATFFHYIVSENFLPYLAHWDANNHLLNSALMYPMYKVFGAELIWLRLPNLLAFTLYAYFAYKLVQKLQGNALKMISFIALITATLVVEFFGQMRGYGLSLGFLMAGLYFISVFAERPSYRNQISVWIFMALAIGSNMSLMLSLLIVIGMVSTIVIKRHSGVERIKQLALVAFFGGVPVALAALYSFEMKSRGLLYYGEGDSFLEITVHTLVKYTLGIESTALDWIIMIVGGLASVCLILKLLWGKLEDWNPGSISGLLLIGNGLGAIFLKLALDVNFPEDRVAIYFVPYFILSLAFLVSDLSKYQGAAHAKWAGTILLIFPISFLAKANFKNTGVWDELALSSDVYEYLAKQQAKTETPLIIDGYFLFSVSWSYERLRHKEKLPPLMHERIDKTLTADYGLCYGDGCEKYKNAFHEVFKDQGGMSVYKRNQDLETTPIKTISNSAGYNGDGAYFNLFETQVDSILHTLLIAEISLSYLSEFRPVDTNLIIAANDSAGTSVYYDYIPLRWLQKYWDGETIRFRRPIILPESSQRMIIYVWNIQEAGQEIGDIDIEIFAVKP